jgi:hypothetical protein
MDCLCVEKSYQAMRLYSGESRRRELLSLAVHLDHHQHEANCGKNRDPVPNSMQFSRPGSGILRVKDKPLVDACSCAEQINSVLREVEV